MKKCPYCAKAIQDTAIKCRYCRKWLKQDEYTYGPQVVDERPIGESKMSAMDKKQAKWFVLALLVVILISIIIVQVGPDSSEATSRIEEIDSDSSKAISRIDTMDSALIEVTPRIEAIIISDNGESCIIVDGKLAHEGDIINGFRILKIYPDKVEFEKNGNLWVSSISKTITPAAKHKKPIAKFNPIVYITRTGQCYHSGSCGYLRRSKIPIPLSEARKWYRPCSRCL